MTLSWWEKGLWQICMHHWAVHAKDEFQKFSTRCQTLGGGPFHNLWSWTEKWQIYIDIFYEVSCNIKHITAISNVHFQ